MIWVTWRQQRAELLVCAGVLLLMGAFFLKTGLDIRAGYIATGASACAAQPADALCASAIDQFRHQFGGTHAVHMGAIFLPLLFGLLLAAPFALELEQRTYRVALTQTITRLRWVSLKVVVIVSASALAGLCLSVLLSWWNAPLDQVGNRLNRNPFELEGAAPMVYTVYVAALCIAAGAVLRQSTLAFATTLIGFIVLRVGLQLKFQATFLAPLVTTVPVKVLASGRSGLSPGDYVVEERLPATWDRTAHLAVDACQGGFQSSSVQLTCLARHAPHMEALLWRGLRCLAKESNGGMANLETAARGGTYLRRDLDCVSWAGPEDRPGFRRQLYAPGGGELHFRLGHSYTMDQINQLCGNPGASQAISPAAAKDLYISCYNQHGISEVILYQPADRYWLFQGIESAIFVAMAAILLMLAVWWIRPRIA